MQQTLSPRQPRARLFLLLGIAGGVVAALSVLIATIAALCDADDSLLGSLVVVMVVALLGEGVLIGVLLGERERPSATSDAAVTRREARAALRPAAHPARARRLSDGPVRR